MHNGADKRMFFPRSDPSARHCFLGSKLVKLDVRGRWLGTGGGPGNCGTGLRGGGGRKEGIGEEEVDGGRREEDEEGVWG